MGKGEEERGIERGRPNAFEVLANTDDTKNDERGTMLNNGSAQLKTSVFC